jgi:hypothetical protein
LRWNRRRSESSFSETPMNHGGEMAVVSSFDRPSQSDLEHFSGIA